MLDWRPGQSARRPDDIAGAEAAGGQSASDWDFRSVVAALVMPVALCAIAALLVGIHVRGFTRTSPIDELQHIDYLIKAPEGHVVQAGELLGQEALREEACRGKDQPGATLPPCDSSVFDHDDWPAGGYSTAHFHPPTYYWLTGIAAERVRDLLALESVVTAARLMGAVWLAVGLVLTWAIGKRLGVAGPALLGGMLLLASTPTVMHASATVNPDATALAIGGGVLLAALWAVRNLWAVPVLIVLCLLAGLTKMTNLMAVGAAAIFLLLEASERDQWKDRVDWGRMGLAVLAVVVGLAAAGTWVVVSYERALLDPASLPISQMFAVTSLPVNDVLTTFMAFVTPVREGFIAEPLRATPLTATFMQIFDRLLIVGVLGTLLLSAARGPLRALALGAGVTMVIAGPQFALLVYVSQQAFIPPPPRYALSLAPALVVLLGGAARRPPWSWFLLALGCVSVGILVVGLL